jgi:hypothetical protein
MQRTRDGSNCIVTVSNLKVVLNILFTVDVACDRSRVPSFETFGDRDRAFQKRGDTLCPASSGSLEQIPLSNKTVETPVFNRRVRNAGNIVMCSYSAQRKG